MHKLTKVKFKLSRNPLKQQVIVEELKTTVQFCPIFSTILQTFQFFNMIVADTRPPLFLVKVTFAKNKYDLDEMGNILLESTVTSLV